MKQKKIIHNNIEYNISTNDHSKIKEIEDNIKQSTIKHIKPNKKANKNKELEVLNNLSIKSLKPSEVDTWVDNNIKNINDLKMIIKELIKLNCNRPFKIKQ